MSQSVTFGVYLQELLARIYTMAGKPAQAVERLEVVLAHPSLLSRDRLPIARTSLRCVGIRRSSGCCRGSRRDHCRPERSEGSCPP